MLSEVSKAFQLARWLVRVPDDRLPFLITRISQLQHQLDTEALKIWNGELSKVLLSTLHRRLPCMHPSDVSVSLNSVVKGRHPRGALATFLSQLASGILPIKVSQCARLKDLSLILHACAVAGKDDHTYTHNTPSCLLTTSLRHAVRHSVHRIVHAALAESDHMAITQQQRRRRYSVRDVSLLFHGIGELRWGYDVQLFDLLSWAFLDAAGLDTGCGRQDIPWSILYCRLPPTVDVKDALQVLCAWRKMKGYCHHALVGCLINWSPHFGSAKVAHKLLCLIECSTAIMASGEAANRYHLHQLVTNTVSVLQGCSSQESGLTIKERLRAGLYMLTMVGRLDARLCSSLVVNLLESTSVYSKPSCMPLEYMFSAVFSLCGVAPHLIVGTVDSHKSPDKETEGRLPIGFLLLCWGVSVVSRRQGCLSIHGRRQMLQALIFSKLCRPSGDHSIYSLLSLRGVGWLVGCLG
uniref:Uncharacterized protein n=1 Tax=Vitrella brassicaformis TaxID=1169539 RepID=A0A7S1JNJ1_9ALVE|mmetsp:Transcript_17455/g.41934  ORF Transcript_17455/g.41934 Transcript_17455/m.41934 type:complete len:466 (+) Transcript_17455:129-1526(+)